MGLFRYGNYYGMGWTAGGLYKDGEIPVYIHYLKTVESVDEIDEIAKYHDIGLELARDPRSGFESDTVNWECGRMFWRVGGIRGKFTASILWLAVITRIGRCYLKRKYIPAKYRQELMDLLAGCDVIANRTYDGRWTIVHL